MKKILLFLLLFPALLYAQSEKYMAGAVPEIDGKVVFMRELNVQDFSKEQIMKALTEWCNNTFIGQSDRVLYTNAEDGEIAAQGEDEMLIKIGLFPGKVRVLYVLSVKCSEGKCTLTTSKIKYKNNPSSDNPNEVITAEEFITDKHALNKAKTKLFKGTGDYRSNTIDIVDKLAADAQSAVYAYYAPPVAQVAQQPAPRPVTAAATRQEAAQTQTQKQAAQVQTQTVQVQTQAAQKTAQAQSQVTATVSISPVKIPENLIKAVAEKGLHIVAVNGRRLNNAIAGKGIINTSSDKASVMFTLDSNTDNILFILEMADNYTLELLDENNRAALSLNCKKSQQFDKTFIGEIVEVKIK